MFELDNMLGSAEATRIFIAASIFFVVVVWGAPILHRLVLPPSLHNNAVARAAAVALLLVAATVTATMTMRSSATRAEAGSAAPVTLEQLHKNVDLQSLPVAPPPEAF